jgi:hypothetical protein
VAGRGKRGEFGVVTCLFQWGIPMDSQDGWFIVENHGKSWNILTSCFNGGNPRFGDGFFEFGQGQMMWTIENLWFLLVNFLVWLSWWSWMLIDWFVVCSISSLFFHIYMISLGVCIYIYIFTFRRYVFLWAVKCTTGLDQFGKQTGNWWLLSYSLGGLSIVVWYFLVKCSFWNYQLVCFSLWSHFSFISTWSFSIFSSYC